MRSSPRSAPLLTALLPARPQERLAVLRERAVERAVAGLQKALGRLPRLGESRSAVVAGACGGRRQISMGGDAVRGRPWSVPPCRLSTPALVVSRPRRRPSRPSRCCAVAPAGRARHGSGRAVQPLDDGLEVRSVDEGSLRLASRLPDSGFGRRTVHGTRTPSRRGEQEAHRSPSPRPRLRRARRAGAACPASTRACRRAARAVSASTRDSVTTRCDEPVALVRPDTDLRRGRGSSRGGRDAESAATSTRGPAAGPWPCAAATASAPSPAGPRVPRARPALKDGQDAVPTARRSPRARGTMPVAAARLDEALRGVEEPQLSSTAVIRASVLEFGRRPQRRVVAPRPRRPRAGRRGSATDPRCPASIIASTICIVPSFSSIETWQSEESKKMTCSRASTSRQRRRAPIRSTRRTERLVSRVHERPARRGLRPDDGLEEVGALRQLEVDRRRAVLGADLALPGEDDARDLERREVQEVAGAAC